MRVKNWRPFQIPFSLLFFFLFPFSFLWMVIVGHFTFTSLVQLKLKEGDEVGADILIFYQILLTIQVLHIKYSFPLWLIHSMCWASLTGLERFSCPNPKPKKSGFCFPLSILNLLPLVWVPGLILLLHPLISFLLETSTLILNLGLWLHLASTNPSAQHCGMEGVV